MTRADKRNSVVGSDQPNIRVAQIKLHAAFHQEPCKSQLATPHITRIGRLLTSTVAWLAQSHIQSFKALGQWFITRRDAGVLEFFLYRISPVKRCSLLRQSIFQEFLLATNGWPKSLKTLVMRCGWPGANCFSLQLNTILNI